MLSSADMENLKNTSMKKAKIISMPNIGSNGRKKMTEDKSKDEAGTSYISESGLKLNIDGKGLGDSSAISHLNSQDYDEDDDDFGDEEMDDFDVSVIQSAAALDRGEKKLFNKLRPNEWSAKVVSTPNIWHKD